MLSGYSLIDDTYMFTLSEASPYRSVSVGFEYYHFDEHSDLECFVGNGGLTKSMNSWQV